MNDEYLIDALPGYCKDNYNFDFCAYATKIMEELEGK